MEPDPGCSRADSLVRDGFSGMNILFISRHSPFPPSSGAAQRSDLIGRALATCSDVDVLVLADPGIAEEVDLPYGRVLKGVSIRDGEAHPFPRLNRFCPLASKIRLACSPRYGFHPSPTVAAKVHRVIEQGKYDAIVVRYLNTFSQCALVGYGDRIVVDIDDLPAQAYQTMTVNTENNPAFRAFLQFKQRGIARYTRRLVQRCNRVWLANPEQVAAFPNASCLPNIPYPFFRSGRSVGPEPAKNNMRVLFVGYMSYRPNEEAVAFYVSRVWPSVFARRPDAELRIVGGGLPESTKRRWEQVPGVRVLGYVDDVSEEYHACAMVIAPVFSGGGTNIKVLEAMSFRRPCLISAYAAKGLGDVVKDGETALIGNSPEDFAERTVALLQEESLRREIGDRAGLAIGRAYSFSVICHEVKQTLSKVLQTRGRNDVI